MRVGKCVHVRLITFQAYENEVSINQLDDSSKWFCTILNDFGGSKIAWGVVCRWRPWPFESQERVKPRDISSSVVAKRLNNKVHQLCIHSYEVLWSKNR